MEIEIQWAKRVDPKLIRRLYASDAKRIQNGELIDEVGYGLYARSESLIKANRAHHDFIVDCPSCGREVVSDVPSHEGVFACICGWSMTRQDYHATYRRKQLVAITIVQFAEKFMSDWKKARDSYAKKMKAIDYLIHCFHYELENDRITARPAAVNFIDCALIPSIELILELAYGNGSQEYNDQMQRWIANAKASHLSEFILAKENEIRERSK